MSVVSTYEELKDWSVFSTNMSDLYLWHKGGCGTEIRIDLGESRLDDLAVTAAKHKCVGK